MPRAAPAAAAPHRGLGPPPPYGHSPAQGAEPGGRQGSEDAERELQSPQEQDSSGAGPWLSPAAHHLNSPNTGTGKLWVLRRARLEELLNVE